MFVGAIKWFDNAKGFGLLVLPNKQTLFLHIRGFSRPVGMLKTGDVVVGTKKKDGNKDRDLAANCSLVHDFTSWVAVNKALTEQEDSVYFSFPPGEHGIYPSFSRPPNRHSLFFLSLGQLHASLSFDDFFQVLVRFYEKELSAESFLAYARHLEMFIPTLLGMEKGKVVLNDIFGHFGQNVDSDKLFVVWKRKLFHFLGFEKGADYEIPEDVLNSHATEIGLNELERIKHYSCGPSFCAGFIPAYLENIDEKQAADKHLLLPYIAFLEEQEQQLWKERLSLT
ncbi:cold-shock protein [Olivibacter sitiensis]|uniref:cold-shock protein n=1 Tax=Olivibacter sitiensis TaxID=376470 RepID=UPI00040CD18A|nr:cold shock domain-containing protein [Olivibacter sitiensis]